jgi:SAM-dependent methyltransferase
MPERIEESQSLPSGESEATVSQPAGGRRPLLDVRPRLLVASALMLFGELALIRWTGSNIVHLSYFSNFVLLGSFLGIGLGVLRASKPRRPPLYSPIALAALIVFVSLYPVTVNRYGRDLIYFTSLETTGPPPWVVLPLVFLIAAVVLMGPGELVGGCFQELPRLEAYRLDLVGSLTGIVGFTALAFLGAPPVVWGALVAVGFLVLLVPRGRPAVTLTAAVTVSVPMVIVVVMLAVESLGTGTSWSPYYKVVEGTAQWRGQPIVHISVNGVPHQIASSAAARLDSEPQYGLPYQRTPGNRLDDVLIIGAGSGTDVAIALGKGAKHVDAVEIDPKLREIGNRHPDRPYDDPRVTTHIDDGRAFLQRTDKRYDLILFALPDSLTLVQGASSIRLESYLFTEEAFRTAHDRLKPGGAFSMYNYYREDWLVGRLAQTARAAFGHEPCVDVIGGGLRQAVVTAGRTAEDQRCQTRSGAIAEVAEPVSDDRPFLYLRDGAFPPLYVITLLLILAASLLAVRMVAGPYRRMRPYRDLFLLGVAFLLLETKSITSFALLFGTTWVVNAIVFAGVLVAVLAAVEVTRRWRTPSLPVMYGVLFAGLALGVLVPNSWLLGLSVGPRAVIAVAVAFLPIFAANVVFAKRFAETADGPTAFGANLLGAMVGGCLEYLAILVGFHALLLVAAAIYLGAFLLLPKRERAAVA